MSSPKAPLIEITGVWLPNKGAELMAWTTVAELSKRLPAARFCSGDQGDRSVRAEMGMPHLPGSGRKERSLATKLLGPKWDKARREVTHVIDISGFAYGDHWGASKARNRAGLYLKGGWPVYLMPQAFGPFEDTALRKEMTNILRNVRMVAARDTVSHGHISELVPERDFPIMPDLTFSLDASALRMSQTPTPYAAFVPNAKLVDTGSVSEADLLSLFDDVAQRVRALGLEPKVVLHEPVADRQLADKIAQRVGADTVEIEDARALKSYVGDAACVVTARFHGLVNGLSAATPSFALGWSHKYVELLSDFGCPAHAYHGDRSAFLAAFDTAMGSAETRKDLSDRLALKGTEVRAKLSGFWDDVAEDIQSSARTSV